MKLFSVCINN